MEITFSVCCWHLFVTFDLRQNTPYTGIYSRAGGSTISYIFVPVPGPKHPLANKLFDMFGVNHGVERLWPIPWHVT